MAGDEYTGVTAMQMDEGLDTGDMLLTEKLPIEAEDTTESLTVKLSELGAGLIVKTLKGIAEGSLSPVKQSELGEHTYAGILKKEDGEISFSMPAERIHALIRASYPWPKAYVSYGSERLYLSAVYGSAFSLSERCTEEPGTVVALDKKKGLKVATEDYYLYVTRLQAPSRKEMDALSFVNGNRGIIGAKLG